MAQTFYTLEEAANVLGLPPDELSHMAQQRKVRAFADGSSWRFRSQDINEMASKQAAGGDPEPPADEPALAPAISGLAASPPTEPGLDDDLIPFDAGLDVDAPAISPPKTDDDLIPIDDLLDIAPPAGGASGINLGGDLALAPTGSQVQAPAAKPESDVRLKLEPSNSEFELTVDSNPAMDPVPESLPAAGARATGGPMMLEADPGVEPEPFSADPGLEQPFADPGLEPEPLSALDSDPNAALGLDLAPESAPAPDLDAGMGFEPGPETAPMPDLDAGLGLESAAEPTPMPDLDAGLAPETTPVPDLDAGLAPETTPVPDLDAGLAPETAPLSDSDPGLGLDLAPAPDGNDNEVSVDFDSSTLDDSMVSMGGPRADSDVRLEAAGVSQAPLDAGAPPVESFQTEEIDLDAELQQAEQASQERRGKTKPVPDSKVRGTPMPPKGTMLPTSSPFELSADDLEFSTSGSSVDQPMGSEFELTLAPEDGSSPLNLGDDEDVDLGGLPGKDASSSSARSELSGINLHDPADSGISLDEGAPPESDSVDFELTVDDDGPKTILKSKSRLPDSDSEFELTLEDDSSGGSLPGLEVESSSSSSDSDQKDIFETDFNLPSLEGEESRSEAVALDGSDTDLESSDFDLAVSDTDLESHAAAAVDESGSEVVVLPDEEDAEAAAPKKKSRTSGGSLDSVDELLLDDDGLEVEDEDDDELVAAEPTVPAAQAEWGVVPVFLLVPCVLVMFVAGLMSYELLHGMWGYHAASKPSGLVVRGIAGLFDADLPKE